MARQEEAREDLLREATALIERVELSAEDFGDSFVAGFRRDGAASFFFGQQIVYQFNSASELRRGFLDGRLYKAECGRLVELRRQRTSESVDLVRHELTDLETSQFTADAHQRLQKLHGVLCTGQFQMVGQVSPQGDLVGRLRDWLANLGEPIPVARSPRVT
jgi:hypothetical protein